MKETNHRTKTYLSLRQVGTADNCKIRYENMSMQYSAIFHGSENENLKKNDNFLIFAQNIDCGCTLDRTASVNRF